MTRCRKSSAACELPFLSPVPFRSVAAETSAPIRMKKAAIMKRLLSTFALAGAMGLCAFGAQAATKLEQVKSKGFVQCGVSQGLPGFSNPNDKGEWSGLDVEFCRAVAAAIFGDATKVKFTPLSAKDRFTALQSGDIDILSRNTTWTITRDTSLGLNFTGVTYYDGQGFMIRKDKKVNSALELSGASVCTQTGTTTEQNLADYFRANNMTYEVIAFATNDEVVKAYDAGRCDVLTTDRSGLAGERLKLTNPDDHVVLPEIISKEPLGPVVAHGDDQWFDIVKWVLFAQLNAEELGVNSKNVDDQLKNATNPEIKRLLGTEGKYGEGMGIGNDWGYLIIKNVGNYAEMYDRTVGPDTPLKLTRGLNALWNKGGIQYAPPIR